MKTWTGQNWRLHPEIDYSHDTISLQNENANYVFWGTGLWGFSESKSTSLGQGGDLHTGPGARASLCVEACKVYSAVRLNVSIEKLVCWFCIGDSKEKHGRLTHKAVLCRLLLVLQQDIYGHCCQRWQYRGSGVKLFVFPTPNNGSI